MPIFYDQGEPIYYSLRYQDEGKPSIHYDAYKGIVVTAPRGMGQERIHLWVVGQSATIADHYRTLRENANVFQDNKVMYKGRNYTIEPLSSEQSKGEIRFQKGKFHFYSKDGEVTWDKVKPFLKSWFITKGEETLRSILPKEAHSYVKMSEHRSSLIHQTQSGMIWVNWRVLAFSNKSIEQLLTPVLPSNKSN
ncbi:hypothetical protein N781_03995 [Pontibacillus halophilus JSM 076056 = DSM 19796]|uniref:YgjP-like metallopeptidase domain-containing protein n=1 Tax=Pontibacillus halophilus JSM 076056 = DSM 19796 TaxID=1385510 RepID=A0A0A5GKK3_9BACI|nr:YgjP-like metallopeptidase domain-containing protein [Pontibacillus halophilus]KGX91695.1 hypothetical protein N781_03995 [Pontibacillus halophilus JSM 076056 = DSM 19796]